LSWIASTWVESIEYVESSRRRAAACSTSLSKIIVDNVFEIGEKAINSVSRWWFVESAVVLGKAVLKFSCNWMCAVDILVVAVQKAAKEVWWFVNSCSPPLRGGEHVVLQQKFEFRVLEQWYCLGSRDTQEVIYRSYVM